MREVQEALFAALGPDGLDLLELNPTSMTLADDKEQDAKADFNDVEFRARSTDQVQFNLHLRGIPGARQDLP